MGGSPGNVSEESVQLILQLFSHFTYVTAHSPTLPSLYLRQRLFIYVTWRAAHVIYKFYECKTN